MNIHKPHLVGVIALLLAAALSACGGGDEKSGATEAPATAATTTIEVPVATEAPPTTVEETTTSEAPPDLSYEIVLEGDYDNGSLIMDVATDGTYPLEAENPFHDGLTFQEFMELPEGTVVCLHEAEEGDITVSVLGTGIYSLQDLFTYLGIHVKHEDGGSSWRSAPESGLITYPDGSWAEGPHVTLNSC